LTKYMPAVVGYRERLATLQGAWDSLALLSHLSDDGTNLSNTREAFESLAADLVTHLETETHKKALLAAALFPAREALFPAPEALFGALAPERVLAAEPLAPCRNAAASAAPLLPDDAVLTCAFSTWTPARKPTPVAAARLRHNVSTGSLRRRSRIGGGGGASISVVSCAASSVSPWVISSPYLGSPNYARHS